MNDRHFSRDVEIAAGENIEERDYWLGKLARFPGRVGFPCYYKKPVFKDGEGYREGTVSFRWEGEFFSPIAALSNRNHHALHVILTAALMTLLQRYTGQEDIVVGTPIYRQRGDEGARFINTVLALRNSIDKDKTFKELLMEVKTGLLEAVKNQNYPLQVLAEPLDIPADDRFFPLFDVAVVLENIHDIAYMKDILVNLLFSFNCTDTYLEGVVRYNGEAYDREAVEAVIGHYKGLLETLSSDINASLSAAVFLSKEEKKQLLHGFNNIGSAFPNDKTITRLFLEQVPKNPGNEALSDCRENLDLPKSYSFERLNRLAGTVAAALREKGITPGAVVGIMVERSVHMIAGLLGILKGGAAYLPLNPQNPQQRTHYMLEDSGAELILSTRRLMDKDAFFREVLFLEDFVNQSETAAASDEGNDDILNASNIAYIIYTSGSTGTPKGVAVSHANLSPLLHWGYRYFSFKPGDRTLQNLSFYFDYSAWEMFMTLTSGATLVVAPDSVLLDPLAMIAFICDNGITILRRRS